MSSTCSVLLRDRVSVEVAAQQVGAHPQTLLTRSTFPVRYPVRAPERGPDGKPTPNAETWESRSALATPGTGTTLSSTCSVLPRDRVSVEVAAQQVGAHPQTLLTRSTFPVHYPVLAPERGPDGKPTPNAETWESPSALATGHQRQPCRLFPRPPPSGAQDDRWFVGDPLGLTPSGYELAPHTGLD